MTARLTALFAAVLFVALAALLLLMQARPVSAASLTRDGHCFEVSTPNASRRDGGGDPTPVHHRLTRHQEVQ